MMYEHFYNLLIINMNLEYFKKMEIHINVL